MKKTQRVLPEALLWGWWWAPLRWLALPYLWHQKQQMRFICGEDVEN